MIAKKKLLCYNKYTKGRKNMKFLIKNYSKDADNNKEILATVLFEVETIKEAQEKMAEFITKIKDNWKTELNKNNKSIAAAMIVNLYHILDGMDIENYRNENYGEIVSKFDYYTRNVLDPTDKPIVAYLSDLTKIIFEKSKCDISGMYFQDQEEDWDEETFGMKMPFEKATYNIWDIPLTRFEECVKKIPDTWLDEDAGIVFSARNY